MSEPEHWEEEKIRRLQGDSKRTPRQDAPEPGSAAINSDAAADIPPRARAGNAYNEPRPAEDIKTAFTVKISTIVSFFIAGTFIMPLLFAGARMYFEREIAHGIALLLAYMTTFRIGSMLEKRSWPGTERLNIIKAVLILAGGGGILILLFVWIFGSAGIVKKQSDYAAEVEKRNVVSERQLPLAGYEHESETRKYLKKVGEARSLIGSSRPGEGDAEYGNYRRVYVEPLKEMGYEFDITLRMAAQRFLVREIHKRSGDDVELLVFNAVCFRNRLFEDEIITPETRNSLGEVAFAWVRTPVPDVAAYMQKLAVFEARCPLTDPGVMYKN